MMQAFVVVFREGIEAFLIVAITIAYLRKTSQHHLVRTVLWGVAGSLVASAVLGLILWRWQEINQPFWEGVLGIVTVILVATLIVHMMKLGPHLRQDMESQLAKITAGTVSKASAIGVFWFTVLMVSREGMEMALLLFQIQDPLMISGVLLGIAAAVLVAFLWQQFSYLIHLGNFFKITSIFLFLFALQITVHAFHEFTEAGIFPNSEMLHAATEPFSSEGIYGKWFMNAAFLGCAAWLVGSWLLDKFQSARVS